MGSLKPKRVSIATNNMKIKIKTLAVAVAMALVGVVGAQAQGQINFFTFNSGVAPNPDPLQYGRVNLPATLGGGLASAPYTAQLYGGTSQASLAPIGSPVNLNQGVANGGIVTVSGVGAGTAYFYQLVVAATSQTLQTSSAIISVTLGGTPAGGGQPIAIPVANGFTSFALTPTAVPEPSVIVLAAVGCGLVLLRRRSGKA